MWANVYYSVSLHLLILHISQKESMFNCTGCSIHDIFGDVIIPFPNLSCYGGSLQTIGQHYTEFTKKDTFFTLIYIYIHFFFFKTTKVMFHYDGEQSMFFSCKLQRNQHLMSLISNMLPIVFKLQTYDKSSPLQLRVYCGP